MKFLMLRPRPSAVLFAVLTTCAADSARTADPVARPQPTDQTPAGDASSSRPSLPWTVPPPGAGGSSQTTVSPPAAETAPQSNVDLERPAADRARPLRFAGRNGAVLDGPAKGLRQREGTRIVERSGRFEVHGDRVIFLSQAPEGHFVVLENLALERVVKAIEEAGPQLQWTISGTLSEYRSSNYLMISRALIKSLPGAEPARRPNDPTAANDGAGPGSAGESPVANLPPSWRPFGESQLVPQPLSPPTAARRLTAPR